MHQESRSAVIAALLANLAIALSKAGVAFVTSSSAMFSEAIHSFADCGNQVLLLVGAKLARKPPDDDHPFGHGKDIYFWSLLVAFSMFMVGAVVSISHGIEHTRHPEPIERPFWAYLVLVISLAIETFSWMVALRALRRIGGRQSLWRSIVRSKEPSLVVVFLEDTAALVGLAIALAGVTLAHFGGWLAADGVASVLIGLLLAVFAFVISYEMRSLLVGESASPEDLAVIRGIAAAHPAIEEVRKIRSMHLGPSEILVEIGVRVRPGLEGAAIARAIDEIEAEIRSRHPAARFIQIELK